MLRGVAGRSRRLSLLLLDHNAAGTIQHGRDTGCPACGAWQIAVCRGFAADIAQHSEASTHSSEVHTCGNLLLLPSAAFCWHAMDCAWSTMELQYRSQRAA